MVVLAVLERPHVEVGGLPAQEWALRVTLVFRREGSEWRLAHRHADALAKGVSLEQAAAPTRGGAAWSSCCRWLSRSSEVVDVVAREVAARPAREVGNDVEAAEVVGTQSKRRGLRSSQFTTSWKRQVVP